MTMFSFTPEEKKPEKRKPVKQTLVETIGGRNVFLEDGDMLILEEFAFWQSRAVVVTENVLVALAILFLIPEKLYGAYLSGMHRHLRSEFGYAELLAMIIMFLPKYHGDHVLLEMRDKDVVSGTMRLGRPKNVRYTLGRTLLGYTIFVWDDDGKRPPKRSLYSSYSRANVDRMAALIDRFLGRGPAPEPEQIEWPPAPIRQVVSLAADAGEAP